MAVEWARSADKHDVAHEDALNAIAAATSHVSGFEPSRIPGGIAPDGWIGPSRAGLELEVFAEVEVKAPSGLRVFIFHVMPVREKTRRMFQAALNRRDR